MPTLHREGGFEVFFRALDKPEPPHVRVKGNGGKAKVWLSRDPAIADVARYTRRDRTRIVRITEEHRVERLAAWHRFFSAGE